MDRLIIESGTPTPEKSKKMRAPKSLWKAGNFLTVSCLLFFSTYDVATAKGAVTKKCQIKGIPQKIEAYLDNSPHLQARKKSGKWIALDYVTAKTDVAIAYKCISAEMLNTYIKSKLEVTLNYRNWGRLINLVFMHLLMILVGVTFLLIKMQKNINLTNTYLTLKKEV